MKRLIIFLGLCAAPAAALANGAHYRGVHFDTSNPSGISSGSIVMDGPLSLCVIDQTADDTTPAIGVTSGCTTDTGGNILQTSATNTGATAITDFDDEVVGQILYVVAGGGANPTTIANGGNFALQSDWTAANTDDVLVLYVQAANDFVEVSRGTAGDYVFASGVEINSTITLANDETIANSTNQKITLAANDGEAEDLSIDLGGTANTALLSSSTGVTTVDAGTMAIAATGGDFGDSNVTNVGDLACDSVTPDDGTNLSLTIGGAGQLGIGDGTYAADYGPNVFIEGVTEHDDAVWIDDFMVIGDDGSAANVILRASSNTFDFRNASNTDYANVQGESFKEFGTGFIGTNGETITNGTNGALTLTGVGSTNNEDLTISLEAVADTVQLSSSTGVVNLDTGALAVSATGLDAGDAAVTNVSDIALDSITPDGTDISVTIGAGTLGIGDGTYSWGHTPNVGIEGIAEVDGQLWVDNTISFGPGGGGAAAALLDTTGGYARLRNTSNSAFLGWRALNFRATGGAFTGANVEQIENDVDGVWTLRGTGGTYNEDLDINFELDNEVAFTSTTGVTLVNFPLIQLASNGLDTSADITLANDETIGNGTNNQIKFSADGAEDISFDLGTVANEVSLLSGSGVTDFDTGSLKLRVGNPTADANYAVHVKETTNGGGLRITNTGGSSNNVMQRDVASSADGDMIAYWFFNARDDGDNESEYARFSAEVQNPANGSEEGIMRFGVTSEGSSDEYIRLDGTLAVQSVVLSKPLVVPTYTYHKDIPIGAAVLGPTAPASVKQDGLVYYQVDPGDELGGRFEVPDQWDAASDIDLEVYVATVNADTIADTETIVVDCDYRVISWGTETTEGGNAAAVSISGTYTQSGAGTNKSTHKIGLTFDYDHANHPISIGDDIVFLCTDGGGTYSSSPLWSKFEAEIQVTGIPNH